VATKETEEIEPGRHEGHEGMHEEAAADLE
jgi:hypothetical protein